MYRYKQYAEFPLYRVSKKDAKSFKELGSSIKA